MAETKNLHEPALTSKRKPDLTSHDHDQQTLPHKSPKLQTPDETIQTNEQKQALDPSADNDSSGESDLSDDPLAEVDLDNILPSRTRRRSVHPGLHIAKDVRNKGEADDDVQISRQMYNRSSRKERQVLDFGVNHDCKTSSICHVKTLHLADKMLFSDCFIKQFCHIQRPMWGRSWLFNSRITCLDITNSITTNLPVIVEEKQQGAKSKGVRAAQLGMPLGFIAHSRVANMRRDEGHARA
ncbi:hypothetical protein GOBAR_DD19862 [Gossypium barbadense]|nr:hypothetical protein GOBAR_DD19862 [Gossypium barbadense]